MQFIIFLQNCSACFGWYLHPSSGAHVTVITASGTGQAVFATFRCHGGVGMSSESSTIVEGSSHGLTSARCCSYSAPDDGWRYHPKHAEQFCRNIINCI